MYTHKDHRVFENSLLCLRFIGNELEYRSVPIYELGTTLIAIQRIVNKAYLFNQDRLDKAARPSEQEREEVALQIGSRKNASDGYGLIPVLMEHPVVAPLIVLAVKEAVSALWAYSRRTVLEPKKSLHRENQTLIIAIYPEVRQLTERVGGLGKVSALEIAEGRSLSAQNVVLKQETKVYVKEVERKDALGLKTSLKGYVRRLHLTDLDVEIRARQRLIKVRVNATDFVELQERARPDSPVFFRGHPIHRLGEDTGKFKRFAADSFVFGKRGD